MRKQIELPFAPADDGKLPPSPLIMNRDYLPHFDVTTWR